MTFRPVTIEDGRVVEHREPDYRNFAGETPPNTTKLVIVPMDAAGVPCTGDPLTDVSEAVAFAAVRLSQCDVTFSPADSDAVRHGWKVINATLARARQHEVALLARLATAEAERDRLRREADEADGWRGYWMEQYGHMSERCAEAEVTLMEIRSGPLARRTELLRRFLAAVTPTPREEWELAEAVRVELGLKHKAGLCATVEDSGYEAVHVCASSDPTDESVCVACHSSGTVPPLPHTLVIHAVDDAGRCTEDCGACAAGHEPMTPPDKYEQAAAEYDREETAKFREWAVRNWPQHAGLSVYEAARREFDALKAQQRELVSAAAFARAILAGQASGLLLARQHDTSRYEMLRYAVRDLDEAIERCSATHAPSTGGTP